jgi:hypothetical protein
MLINVWTRHRHPTNPTPELTNNFGANLIHAV